MGFLAFALLSFLLGILLFFNTDFSKQDWKSGVSGAFILVLIAVGVGLIVITFVHPMGEYKEDSLLSTQEITSYEILDVENYYIESDEFITYFVINEIISENGKEIETPAITKLKSNVEIIKVKDCKMPRVEKYLVKWESSGWTFAKEKDKTVYKIYIPE